MDTTPSADQDSQAAEDAAQAAKIIDRIERAGYTVYLTHHSGVVICVTHQPGKTRVVVGKDPNGDPYATAIQTGEEVGLP